MAEEIDWIFVELEREFLEVVVVHFIVELCVLCDGFGDFNCQIFQMQMKLIDLGFGFEMVHLQMIGVKKIEKGIFLQNNLI